VTVWNRSPGRAEALVAAGAVAAGSLSRAVADAEVVLTVVADDDALLDVCLGPHGVLATMGPAAVLVNISTVAPDTIRHVADADPGGRVVDAPVLGSPDMVAGGGARFFLGCPVELATALDSLWGDLGAGYTHCGPVGTAATMKIVSNLLLITGVAALAEGIATARSQGIPDALVRKVLSDSPVISLSSAVRLDSLLDDAHPGWFSPTLARKDVRLAIGLAEQASVGVRLGPAIEALLSTVVDAGGQWPDFTAVIEALG
jgi:3-hydroxyisobutyrate dehydrogenase-like beta-hydroxyacid dehydrogenase